MSASQHAAQINALDIIAGLSVISIACGALARWCRGAGQAYRDAAELRHRRRMELAFARRGMTMPRRVTDIAAPPKTPGGFEAALPAAAIPSPPGVRSHHIGPGPCRHEAIVPVINVDGELVRWLCRNFERCDARFDRSVAIYEHDLDAPGAYR